ncbi:MAG: sugar transferase [Bryobacterales bacterium]|nr:sugar transferase [Bryobacterales bacterium]
MAGAYLLLLLADFAVLNACHFAGHSLRFGPLTRVEAFQQRGMGIGYEPYLFFVSIYLIVFGFSGLYTRRLSAMEDSALALRACFYSTACALVICSIAHVAELFSRTVIALSALLAAAALPASRRLVKSWLGRRSGWQRPLVLLGVNANALRAARDLAEDSTSGYRILGILTDRPVEGNPPWPVWTVADRWEAIEVCRKWGLRSVVLCENPGDGPVLLKYFHQLEEFADDIKIASAVEGLHSLRLQSEVLRSSYLLTYDNPLTRVANRLLKRFMDLALGLLLALVCLPVFVAVALMIRLSSPGPVLYRSERLGRGGRRFPCLKFRTMHADAQERLLRILGEDENANREYAASFKLRRDPRITRVGAWLRRTSLDELPQLWNVLRGEMSLVGPRPIMPAEIEKYDTDRTNYFRVTCGLTGLWQTSGRSDLDYAERVRLDVFYIRNWSVWLDLVILARTAVQVLRPKGAY